MIKKLLKQFTIVVVIMAIISTLFVSYGNKKEEAFAATNGIKVHFYKPSNWSKANIYYYNDSTEGPKWPGIEMTADGNSWYSYTISNFSNPRVLFNDGSGKQIPDPGEPGKLLTEESWYKDGQWTNYDPTPKLGDINIYVEKPDSWKEIWIWYDSDLSTPQWDTTVLKSSPGEMTNYRTGWYKKTISNTVKVQFLFNDGTWNNKLQSNGSDFVTTKDVWVKKDGTVYYTDPLSSDDPKTDTISPTVIATPFSGRYLTAQKVKFTIVDNADPSPKLYFSLDGTAPQLTDAYLYNGQEITISKDTNIYTIAVDASGNKSENVFVYNIGEYDSNDFREETIYFVMTTRFYDGDPSNNVHCWDDTKAGNPDSDPAWRGDFKGLTDKLDYIKALGFSAIWVTPPVKNSSGYDYHGYHAIDFTEIDPRYKTKYDGSAEESYQKFINAAHAKGFKVIQDIVYNHTGNFGEENLFPMFERNAPTSIYETIETALTKATNSKLPDNYFDLNPVEQYNVRIALMKEDAKDTNHIYHHEKSMEWEGYTCQTGQIAGDCVDLNTENPIVTKYLNNAYNKYISMGVDAFRVDTVKHISRLTFNKEFIPSIKATGGDDFFVFGEVCTRVREVWNKGIPALSAPFYTWKESKNYPWGDRETNEASVYQNYLDNLNVSTQPTSNNAFLDGNNYRTVDTSMKSGLNVIDFPMHWNFANARDAFRVAVEGDQYYNDATWNVVYVDSHDYAPDTAPENQRFSLGQDVWAENLSLMFTFRGIPCIYYGSEIEFQKGKTIDPGPNAPLSQTGRAYFGDYIEGSVETSDFGVYSNATGTISDTLNHPLAQHINRLNRIRRAIPALQKGQYSVQDISGDGMAYKRRYTNAEEGVDSFALITVSGSATFRNIPNGKYVDAVTGQVINVTSGTLTANCSGKGNLRVFVLDLPGNSAPGKIGGYSKYLY